MPNASRPVRSLLFLLSLTVAGCHAQAPPAAGSRLSPELARRVEVLIRSTANVPPNYVIQVGPREPSEVPGFSKVEVNFTAEGKSSKPVAFLISNDGKTMAQFTKYDISRDPKQLVSADGRPARGGPATAPVVIVGFDDLECPFCAKMHAELFPALLQRYGKQVRIVYRDFPLDQHPWAMRAAVDANCLAAQTTPGYWSFVDQVHEHAAELGGADKSLSKANDTLDQTARGAGKAQHADMAALDSCIKKQDTGAIRASIKEGESLGVDSTPALFINGEKLQGAYPIEDVYRMIDNALIASGQTPPPAPKPEDASPSPASSAKPGTE